LFGMLVLQLLLLLLYVGEQRFLLLYGFTCPAPGSPKCATVLPISCSSGVAARTPAALPPHCNTTQQRQLVAGCACLETIRSHVTAVMATVIPLA
jgi:hypothetical protein